MQTNVTTLDAGSAGTIELNDAIYGLEPRQDLIHRMVRYQLLKRMAGTHHAQDRSEVHVTGKKMYKQKGTGSARHGDKSVPQWRGGGKAKESTRAGAPSCPVGESQGWRDRGVGRGPFG
jgi:large subunit ribosomal protein L4